MRRPGMEGGQVADEFLVDAGLGSEIEICEGPGLGKACEPFTGSAFAGLCGFDLDFQQPFQCSGQRHTFGAGLVQNPVECFRRVVELEIGQVGSQLLIAPRFAHLHRGAQSSLSLFLCWQTPQLVSDGGIVRQVDDDPFG